MDRDIQMVDRFEPDWDSFCAVCGGTPTVLAMKNGKVISATEMCGPCTWGEAEMIDPVMWND